jgi:chromosome partitioning protein
MKVITVAAPKGGCGKSTATLVLATRAVQDGKRVAMYDLNADQASLTGWWFARGEPENPQLLELEGKLTHSIEHDRQQGFDYLFIDTPPLDVDLIENAALKSDLVIVPVRSSFFDITAISSIVDVCKRRRRTFAFLMSAVDSRDPKLRKLNEQTRIALLPEGQILSFHLSYSASYISALHSGRAGFEADKKLVSEVDGLWAEVQRLAEQPSPLFGGSRRIYDRLPQ